jgi:hypothetical protein
MVLLMRRVGRHRTRKVQLTQEEARLLGDVIDIHLEGIENSRDPTIDDPSIKVTDDLLELMAQYDSDEGMLIRIREKLDNV